MADHLFFGLYGLAFVVIVGRILPGAVQRGLWALCAGQCALAIMAGADAAHFAESTRTDMAKETPTQAPSLDEHQPGRRASAGRSIGRSGP